MATVELKPLAKALAVLLAIVALFMAGAMVAGLLGAEALAHHPVREHGNGLFCCRTGFGPQTTHIR